MQLLLLLHAAAVAVANSTAATATALLLQGTYKLDGVGPVDNRPSIN